MVLEHIQAAVGQFGDQIMISDLSLDENGALNLVLDDDDVFGIQAGENCVLLSVAIVLQEYDLASALENGFKEVYVALESNNVQVCLSLKEPQMATQPSALIFTAYLDNSQVGVDALMEMIDILWDIRHRLKGLD